MYLIPFINMTFFFNLNFFLFINFYFKEKISVIIYFIIIFEISKNESELKK